MPTLVWLYWGDAKPVRLHHLGAVTVVLSPCRRNAGPTQTKSLVTHLPQTVTARHVVAIYRRRWVEVLCKELTGGVGLGQPQVTNAVGRLERAVAVAIMASLLRLKLRAKDIPADATRRCLGGRTGARRAFGPAAGAHVASDGSSGVMAFSDLSPLSF
jgi:hypothetical protein